ncbi:unnamed protein product [Rhizoctonia solani]|uniref:DUF6533 domain-containing protein n=1 Tax=Rhizoctonia solani TaxID=456999 RepID=A0A8H3CG95_9AGAM|nr:unnamed protein product [Rhizoctonia solani]
MAGRVNLESELLVELIVAGRARLMVARCFAIAGRTLLFYDILTNLEQEVAYVWGKPWSLMRIAYHLNRIWPAIQLGVTTPGVLLPPSCKVIVIASSYGTAFALMLLSPVIISRVWVLYGRRRDVLEWLLLGLAVSVIAVAVILKVQADSHTYIQNPVPDLLSGCLVRFGSSSWIPYGVSLSYESLIFGMTVWKSWTLRVKFGSGTFTSQLLRDGTLYYAGILLVMILCSLGTQIEVLKGAALASGFVVAMTSTMCNQMILSLHAFSNETKLVRLELPLTRVDSHGKDENTYGARNDL